MSVWRALVQGLSLLRHFGVALAAFVVAYAATGALATLWLPFQIVEGRVQVPAPADLSEAMSRLAVGLGLYGLGVGSSLYLLGGVFGGLHRLVRREPFPAGQFFPMCGRHFWTMLRWGLGFFALEFGLAAAVACVIGLIWAATGRSEAMKGLIQAGFSATLILAALGLLFSPVILLERARGAWASFRESARFVAAHPAATLGIMLGVAFIGAVLWGLWLIVAAGVAQLRAALGVAPFAPGLPVFFFGLILLFPQAFLCVYLPAVLTAYHHGKEPLVIPARAGIQRES